MKKTGEIAERLYNISSEIGDGLLVEDVRIGIGYIGVKIEKRGLGLAALLTNELKPGCSRLKMAGTFAGSPASELLKLLCEGSSPLEKALGLATANSIIGSPVPEKESDAIDLMGLTPDDRIAMVGFFQPLVERIRKRGLNLFVIERDERRIEIPDDETKDTVLEKCTVAIITATSIVNDTLEDILSRLGKPRHVAILGPSTPLCEEAFRGTPVTHLGGSVVTDVQRVLQIISEGGGTPEMRPHLRFFNSVINSR
ncbi:MAG: DUF364 domain-containing protein [Deltaproteobacteria bacterium]|nr:DUF364 domain-containing protein [Deltaproteobacteria bacterium]MBN2846083.1 DUF364 domain-containing protein [Deltaproteobacteria bacterium]